MSELFQVKILEVFEKILCEMKEIKGHLADIADGMIEWEECEDLCEEPAQTS